METSMFEKLEAYGDTIEVDEIPIRLNGVSAPELREPLGPQSKRFMRELVLGMTVRCELDGP